MDPARWKKIQEIFHSASELEGDQRELHLELACAGDPSLLLEVRSLLANSPASVFSSPAMEAAAKTAKPLVPAVSVASPITAIAMIPAISRITAPIAAIIPVTVTKAKKRGTTVAVIPVIGILVIVISCIRDAIVTATIRIVRRTRCCQQ